MKEVRIHNDVVVYLAGLFDILIEKGYFSFYGSSAQYIDDITGFIKQNIHTAPQKVAPKHFAKYGHNMSYVAYRRNKRTTWYISFEQTACHYLIRYITNNHVDGQFLWKKHGKKQHRRNIAFAHLLF